MISFGTTARYFDTLSTSHYVKPNFIMNLTKCNCRTLIIYTSTVITFQFSFQSVPSTKLYHRVPKVVYTYPEYLYLQLTNLSSMLKFGCASANKVHRNRNYTANYDENTVVGCMYSRNIIVFNTKFKT